MPEELDQKGSCGCCGTDFRDMNPERQVYICSRRCGESFCSAVRLADHCESGCVRGEFFSPRFSADHGLRPGRNCDLIDEGKERLLRPSWTLRSSQRIVPQNAGHSRGPGAVGSSCRTDRGSRVRDKFEVMMNHGGSKNLYGLMLWLCAKAIHT